MRIALRVRPGSSRDSVGGSYGDPPALVVRTTAPAVDGRATAAVLRLVAAAMGVRHQDVFLVSGLTARTKIVEVVGGDPGVLADLLAGSTR